MRSWNQGRRLSIDIQDEDACYEESFIANDGVFVKGGVAINERGIAMKNNPKTFYLLYDELELGEIIGRGASRLLFIYFQLIFHFIFVF